MILKRKFFATLLLSSASLAAFAGGIFTNTNQSIHFLRNVARDASMEIDAVYTNPAGVSFLKDNGFQFSLNSQTVWQTRTISANYAPFAANANHPLNPNYDYKGETFVPVLPSVMGAWKKDRWAVSGFFGIVGGGGSAEFDNGLPSLEAPISTIMGLATPLAGIDPAWGFNQYRIETMEMTGSSMVYGVQLGASYQIIENMLSGYVGGRVAIARNKNKGEIEDIRVNSGGSWTSAPVFFGSIMSDPRFLFFPAALQEGVAKAAAGTSNKELDNYQTGTGFAPIIGADFKMGNLNIGAKYEFRTHIEMTNHTDKDVIVGVNPDGTPITMFPDGSKVNGDMPAYLALGASYLFFDKLVVSAGYHFYDDKNAKYAKDKQQYIDKGMQEYLIGAEYRFNEKFLVSAGYQISRTGATDAYQSDMSFSLNSSTLGLGCAYNFTEKIRLNVAYMTTFYKPWEKTSPSFYGTPVSGTETFDRTNNVFGIGLDFRL